MSDPAKKSTAVFRVLIKGTIDQVWRELTKTDEVQASMFNSRLHTPGLAPGNPLCMRSPSGRFTNVVGTILEVEKPVRYAHTMRFTTSDDPPSTVVYDLKEVEGGVEFTLTVRELPVGTKSEKQMRSGGSFIVNTLKSVVETGKPSLGARLLFTMFKLMEPFGPAKAKSESWSYDRVKKEARA